MAEPYRQQRIFAFLDPWSAPKGAGFHIIQSLYALGSGGLFGVGLGQSKQKFFYLPEPGTDFIFAVLGEELGFVGSLVILLLYFLLLLRGLRTALQAPDVFGSLLAVGITFWIVAQAMLNIGVVTGSLPVTGITLPFISYGGTSLIVMSISVGILLNISRFAEE
jgi:cell division protein FtsW